MNHTPDYKQSIYKKGEGMITLFVIYLVDSVDSKSINLLRVFASMSEAKKYAENASKKHYPDLTMKKWIEPEEISQSFCGLTGETERAIYWVIEEQSVDIVGVHGAPSPLTDLTPSLPE